MRVTELLLISTVLLLVGCGDSSTATAPTPTPLGSAPAAAAVGAIGATVTINGEARPIVWVELQRASDGFPWAYGTTILNGSWAWAKVPGGDYVVVIKTPPGLTCDATRKSATVGARQPAVVNFACVGDLKGSILGFASAEFGTVASARVTLTGPVNRETVSNRDGFFAFEDLPRGEYLIEACKNPRPVSVGDGATVFAAVDCS